MTVFEVCVLALSIPVLLGAVQIRRAKVLVVADHNHAMRAATFRQLWDVHEELNANNETLRSILNRRGYLSPKRARRIARAHPGDGHLWDLNQALMTLLTRLEGVAMGVNHGVFNLDATWVAAGPSILLTCHRLDHFLAELQTSRKDMFPNLASLRSELIRVGTIHKLQSEDSEIDEA